MPKEIFRITSAGSVDDGKSTILARLLLDTGSIYDDQLAKNYDPSKIADLLDGLESEQSQGITVDVAHRFFDSNTRRYQIADSPGHEQYTRNMATASAGSDALLLVVDSRAGLKPQTKHHLEIALRLGIRDIVFAVNKMDLVNFSQRKFTEISKQIASHLGSQSEHFGQINHSVIPVSGLTGANVVKKSSRLSWFAGKTLLEKFESLKLRKCQSGKAIISVQMVQRLTNGGRRYLGRVLSGEVSVNQQLNLYNKTLKITKLFAAGEEARIAKTNTALSFEIDKDLDLERGDLLTEVPTVLHDQFEVDLVWLGKERGYKGRRYLLDKLSSVSSMSITKISAIHLQTNSKHGEKSDIGPNEVIRANIKISAPQALMPFNEDFHMGRFTVVSPETGQTVAVGTVNFALRRSENIRKYDFKVTPKHYSEITGNGGRVIWFTGLSGSGKSTFANQLSADLYKERTPHFVLDGDNLRFGLNRDLGFTEADRAENVRRTSEVASLMADAGLIVIVALISPTESDRRLAKETIGESRFTLVYVDTPLEICEQRDPKGLYKKARRGELPNLTGIGSTYEPPRDCLKISDMDGGSSLIDRLVF